MAKIMSDFSIGKYRVLMLDGEKPKTPYTKYLIDGEAYDIVPVYDATDCIAVESNVSLKGKSVEFV